MSRALIKAYLSAQSIPPHPRAGQGFVSLALVRQVVTARCSGAHRRWCTYFLGRGQASYPTFPSGIQKPGCEEIHRRNYMVSLRQLKPIQCLSIFSRPKQLVEFSSTLPTVPSE